MFGSSADPLDDQHAQLLQLNGGALLVAAAAAAALALAGVGAGGLGPGSSGALPFLRTVAEEMSACQPQAGAHCCGGPGWLNLATPLAPAPPADLLRLALAGQGLANALTFFHYGWSFRSLLLPLELAVNAATFAVPAADLARGAGLRVRTFLG